MNSKLSPQKQNITLFKSILGIIAIGLLLFACQKTDVEGNKNKKVSGISKVKASDSVSRQYIPAKCADLANPCTDPECAKYLDCNKTATYAGVTITYEASSGMLKFNSVSDANTVLNQLESDYEYYNDSYDAQYPGYTSDALDRMDSINNFDEFRKLKDFEANFPNFTSKRKEIENAENTWMANNFTGTDPDNLDLTFDDFENTVFNSSYSFKVGASTYQLKADGIYVNGVLQTGSSSGGMSIMSTCISGRKSILDFSAGNGKAYKLKVAVHSIGIRSSAKGKVVSFKPKNSGGRKRSRSELAAYAGGNIYTPQCSFNFSFTKRKPVSGFKNGRSLKAVFRGDAGSGGQIVYKTMPGEVSSIYELKSGYSASLAL